MYATSTRTRIVAFLLAILMSTAVLGTTVLSMQPAQASGSIQLIALERVVVSAPATN